MWVLGGTRASIWLKCECVRKLERESTYSHVDPDRASASPGDRPEFASDFACLSNG